MIFVVECSAHRLREDDGQKRAESCSLWEVCWSGGNDQYTTWYGAQTSGTGTSYPFHGELCDTRSE